MKRPKGYQIAKVTSFRLVWKHSTLLRPDQSAALVALHANLHLFERQRVPIRFPTGQLDSNNVLGGTSDRFLEFWQLGQWNYNTWNQRGCPLPQVVQNRVPGRLKTLAPFLVSFRKKEHFCPMHHPAPFLRGGDGNSVGMCQTRAPLKIVGFLLFVLFN